MLKNYFRIAFRNLFRNKVHSLINITGLALGMAAAGLLLLDIHFQLSMDQFHEKKARLYQAYMKSPDNGKVDCTPGTGAPLAEALKNYPEVAGVARTTGSNELFRFGDKKVPGWGYYADPAFLSMFTFPLIKGDFRTALDEPNDIVITRGLAIRIFGNQDPMNKTITTPTGDNFVITGVLKDLPPNTRFFFDYIISWKKLRGPFYWNNQSNSTFVELRPDANPDAFNKKIADIQSRNFIGSGRILEQQSVFLYPFTKVYLEGRFENGKPAGGQIDDLKMLGGLAAILLVIACINFMNLSTARSEKRGKEVGIRKVMGALRPSLVFQFIGESILMALLAGVIALVIVQLILPYFSMQMDAGLVIPWQAPAFWLAVLVFVLLTGVLAGSYPGFYLSSFRPFRVLKGVLQNSHALVTPRKILVVIQFVCSIFLINFTLTYQRQMRHELDRETGYTINNLVYQPLTSDLRRNYVALRNELISTGIATSVSEANTSVTDADWGEGGLKWDGMDPKANTQFVLMLESGGLVETNGLTLVAGRDIDVARYPDDTLSCLINEASAKALGFKNPIGRIIRDVDVKWKIVGEVKDFLTGDPDQASQPLLVKGGTTGGGVINIRLNGNRALSQRAAQAEAVLKKYNPGYLTDLHFADQDYQEKFRQTRNTAMLINTFTFIAIFISCMGLLGLAIYMTENRTREIGIRKVLGAGNAGIVSLLTRDFVRLVLISILIASPAAWIFIQAFLQRYSYRVAVNAWILAASGAVALLLAIATVSFHVTRAALRNPVKNLRME